MCMWGGVEGGGLYNNNLNVRLFGVGPRVGECLASGCWAAAHVQCAMCVCRLASYSSVYVYFA